jgi:hypothetical protein
MDIVEVCPICDIAGCRHIRAKQDAARDGYKIVPAMPEVAEKGIQCGLCGMRFDHGKAYGVYCPRTGCPIFARATF